MNPERELEALEIELLLTGVARRYGYDFRNYAPASLTRRVRNALFSEGLESVSDLQARVLRDPLCMERFVESLSVHVTAMFRDPEFYRVIRSEVVPVLRTYPFVRIWHAGCASGEEVYSLAILLEEEGIYDRCRLYATDMSASLLRKASLGVVPLDAMRGHTANYLEAGGKAEFSRYYTAKESYATFDSALRRNMVFSQHNLVSDGAFNEFNLILCRNVLIYFDDMLRARVHTLLYQSLGRFGILGLGQRETVEFTEYSRQFEEIAPGSKLFRKVR